MSLVKKESSAPPALENSAKRPLYLAVAEYLEQEILSGKFDIGDLFPTEQELCKRFDASRFTIREALKRLMELGLVVRRQGSGTRVVALERSENYIQELRTANDVIQYAENTRLSIVNELEVAIDADLKKLLQVTPNETWHKIECVGRLNQQKNICLTSLYLIPKFSSISSQIDTHDGPVFELIENRFGVSPREVKVEIQAGAAGTNHADFLGIEVGSPILKIIRKYIDDRGYLYQVSISEHPADMLSYSISLVKQNR